jgi:glutamate synthase (NADPH/NADH) small chain
MEAKHGFIKWGRQLPEKRPVEERLGDYQEIYPLPSEEESRQQAARCMNCGVPFCHQGCPLGNPIPEFNELAARGHWREAYLRLISTNNFPEFTGRLCPAPCEAACVLAINREPVTIEQIEKTIIERAFAEGWVKPHPPKIRTGRRVAVVGSGPAGLAAASQLNSVGHQVSVYEADADIGGLLRYGVPDFKLEKEIIKRRTDILQAEGIKFLCNHRVGKDLSWTKLRDSVDAVLIAIGAGCPRELPVPGRDLGGVYLAMDYLTQQNKVLGEGLAPEEARIDAAGKRVVILGGGDTGADCLGTALRQGAKSVQQLELMPMPPLQRALRNPWPQWPLIYRRSTSHEEGGAQDFAVLTKQLLGEGGKLSALQAVRVERVQQPGQGPTLQELPNTTFEIPTEMLILAMGFTGPRTNRLRQQLGVELDARGNLRIDKNYATNVDGVFAAGDAQRGPSLIVWAISQGREAARAIDIFLRGDGSSPLLSKGHDQPFDP